MPSVCLSTYRLHVRVRAHVRGVRGTHSYIIHEYIFCAPVTGLFALRHKHSVHKALMTQVPSR